MMQKLNESSASRAVVDQCCRPRAVQAPDLALWVEPLKEDESTHRELRLGFDTQARLSATVVLVFQSGDEIVIHASLADGADLEVVGR